MNKKTETLVDDNCFRRLLGARVANTWRVNSMTLMERLETHCALGTLAT